jgi:hypothetical protein
MKKETGDETQAQTDAVTTATSPSDFPFHVEVAETTDVVTGPGECAIVDNANATTKDFGLAFVRGCGTGLALDATNDKRRGTNAIAVVCGTEGNARVGDYGLAVAGLPLEKASPPSGADAAKRVASTCELGIAIVGTRSCAWTNWGGIAIAGKYGRARVNYFHHNAPGDPDPQTPGVIMILGHEDARKPRPTCIQWHVAVVSPDPKAHVHGDQWYELDWVWDADGQPVLDFVATDGPPTY